MSDKIEGGAGPALAAHSKDAAAPGANPASNTTGKNATGTGTGHEPSDTVSRLSGQARDAASRAASSASEGVDRARQYVSNHTSSAAHQGAELVRHQPVMALLGTAALGMVLGLMLGRR